MLCKPGLKAKLLDWSVQRIAVKFHEAPNGDNKET